MELTPEEVRVLGCLMEKQVTTPEQYPLTLNSLRHACNQTSSRHPVLQLDDHTVETALTGLREKGLIRVVHSVHNRSTKYRHVADELLRLDGGQQAVLAVLLLRGAQTVGELRNRTDRMASFGALAEVEGVLDGLAGRDVPLVARLDRQPGQKDARYVQLLGPAADGGAPPEAAAETPAWAPAGGSPDAWAAERPARERPAEEPVRSLAEELAERVAALEARVAALEELLG